MQELENVKLMILAIAKTGLLTTVGISFVLIGLVHWMTRTK